MKRKVRFVVIGCGHIGKRHAAMIQANPEAELIALVDVKEKNVLGIDHFKVPFFNDISQLLAADLEYDVVNIAVPNGLHAVLAKEIIASGRDVVIEKPMALNAVDAEQVIAMAQEAGRRVFVVMQNRYSPPVAWIKEVVASGILGKLYMVQISCYWNRDQRYYQKGSWHGSKTLDGGTLFTQFSHFIDIMYWLFGDVKNIATRLYDFNHGATTEFEDSGVVQFDFLKEGTGTINFSTSVWDKNLESSITIIAEKGSVKIGGQYMDKVEYCHIDNYTMPDLPPSQPGNDYGAYKGSAANHNLLIQNVIDVLNKDSLMTTTPEEGRAVVHLIERIYAAAKL